MQNGLDTFATLLKILCGGLAVTIQFYEIPQLTCRIGEDENATHNNIGPNVFDNNSLTVHSSRPKSSRFSITCQ
jgi:hypothetical protein